jgi:hypothetical protein
MTERAGVEVDTLTISIPMQLQRRGGRKLSLGSPRHRPPRIPAGQETLGAIEIAHRDRGVIEKEDHQLASSSP